MNLPETITLNVTYNTDGSLDEASLLLALEKAVENRICIIDWVGEQTLRDEISNPILRKMRAINSDVRRTILNEAALAAGVPRWEDDNGNDENDDEISDHGVGL